MNTGSYYGKALIRLDYDDGSIDSYVYPQSVNGGRGSVDKESQIWCVQEDIQTDIYMHGLHTSNKMRHGESMTLLVKYRIDYSMDYWGEHDYEVTFTKVRVIKRRKAKK